MTKRTQILIGMGFGALWAVLIIWMGPAFPNHAQLWQGLAAGLFAAALPMALMIARLAHRRFVDDGLIDGQPLTGGAAIDQRVLTNTVEQLALGLCLWPAIGAVLGTGTLLALGGSFMVMRLLFWIGYHISPPLRAFGFAGTFYPTLAGTIWAVVVFI